MKIELRNVKICNWASQETECFTATLYADDKKIGEVSNDGHGGSNRYGFINREIGEQFYTYCASLPPMQYNNRELKMDADLYIGTLLSEHLKNKQMKRWCSKKTVFRLPNYKEGEYTIIAVKYSPEIKTNLLNKYGPSIEIMNEIV